MGKKNKKLNLIETIFPYQGMILYFLLFFCISLGIVLVITPFLSFAKLILVREMVKVILQNKTPYIHPIPFFKSISISLAVFTGLFFSYRKVSPPRNHSTQKQFIAGFLGLLFLWLLEVGTHVFEIVITKLSISSFLPNYTLNLLLSVGSIGFPVFLWLVLFHPSFLD